MPSDAKYPATLILTSRNRKEELRQAILSGLSQTVPLEIIVIDDGSPDDTAEMVRTEFPSSKYPNIIFDQQPVSRGVVVQRNRGAAMATSPYIVSIDDDAVLSTPNIVAQTLAEFTHPRIGAVAIPYVDVKKNEGVRQRAPSADGIYVTDRFIGTAYAIRRDVFLKVGGYREHLFHQGEEGEFCLRLLEAGYLVRLGSADLVHHYESPRRDFRRMDVYGRRNDVLYAWYNVPMPHMPIHMLGTTVKGLMYATKVQRSVSMAWGVIRGYGCCLQKWRDRRPVRLQVYRLNRLLRTSPLTMDELERRSLLPPMPRAQDPIPAVNRATVVGAQG